MGRIFINYRRQDTEGYVGRLYDHLVKHFERDDIFMDVDSIKPGADFVQVLEDAVAGCDIFLAMIGPAWLNISDEKGGRRLDNWNDLVRIEIASALKLNKHIIPVLVGQARVPAPTELPEDIALLVRRNAIELTHQRFGYDVEKLITAIKEAMPAKTAAKPPIDAEKLKQKEAALKALRLELVGATTSPLYKLRSERGYFPVVGDGNADANIVFIGESPGKSEAEVGRPFIGPSGEVLDEMLDAIKLQREDVYVTNLVLDHPGGHEPLPEEIAFYAPFVDRIIDIIQPGVIATLGRFAMSYILNKYDATEKRGKISQLHGKLVKATESYGDIFIVPLYHPASVLYTPSQKDGLRKDFEKLKLFI